MPELNEDQIKGVALAVVESSPDGVVMIDEQGRILMVNRQTEALFGYRREDLIGQEVELLLPTALRQAHRALRVRYRAEPRVRPMGAGVQLFGLRSDGAEFPVEISLSPMQSEAGLRVIAAVRDISERRLIEAEAREIQRVLDGTLDAVLMFDEDSLRFTYVNRGATAQLGYTREELLRMTPLHIKPALSEEEYRAMGARLAPGESYTYTTTHRRKDGTDIEVEAVLQRPPPGRGESGWMVSIARDLTDRREAERRAQLAEREVAVLEDRQRIARDLHDQVIQRLFASGLALEALAGRIGRSELADRMQEIVTDLDDTIRHLRTSIFQLSTPTLAVSLRAMVLEVCAAQREMLGFDPSVLFEGPVDVAGEAVRHEVLAVIREALSNVARHARASEVSVGVAVSDALALRIADNGVGMALEPPSGGNGLANMRARAERLGGECTIRAGRDGGTVLEWVVPLE